VDIVFWIFGYWILYSGYGVYWICWYCMLAICYWV